MRHQGENSTCLKKHERGNVFTHKCQALMVNMQLMVTCAHFQICPSALLALDGHKAALPNTWAFEATMAKIKEANTKTCIEVLPSPLCFVHAK